LKTAPAPAVRSEAHSVTTAAPDGYTLLVGQTGEIAVNQHWLKGLNYDPDKDLVPIALAAVVPLALVVPSKASYSTLPDFLAALKAKPKMTFASAGIGTPGHFAGELLKLKFDENLTHVPYKGAGPALNDLIGGHVEFYFSRFSGSGTACEGWKSEASGPLVSQALAGGARCADRRRGDRHQRLRFHALGRVFCTARHPAAGHRPVE
jgi:tripartite-type tricarboxylate transporter receptor subunit TctC